ncbi:site-specific integrase [Candidatus Colwellia aromaticivorans]|uniref:site-specific integrase n=1 Tax=Candidatus Colwellia aromaticivorans TaxID=2267621 RepID=UPI000DF2CC83|nr:site-specific integrase [Candidatus Colwellia aromaticivorans]
MKSIQVDRFVSFIDSEGLPVLLPTLFSISMNRMGYVPERKERVNKTTGEVEVILDKIEVSQHTINQYEGVILHFLQYVEQQSQVNSKLPNVHMHTHATSEFINTYLNDYLISDLKKGINTATQVRSVLTAYYNYLSLFEITNTKNLYIYPKLRKEAQKNVIRKRAYKYILKSTRTMMLLECKTVRDELLLRFGFECGLRSMENTSLFLENFTYAKKPVKGFLTLFDELKQKDKQVFEYLLIITKARRNEGSPARIIYIPRSLLEKCHQYYLTERPDSNSNSLFVSYETNHSGNAITVKCATRIFTEVKNKLLSSSSVDDIVLNEENSYHHLRHSFATEKFHVLCRGTPHHSITPGHAVISEMARLMGHKINKKEFAQEVTMRYIRSVDFMLIAEKV